MRQQHRDELGDGTAEIVGLHVVLVDDRRRHPLRHEHRGALHVEVAGEVGVDRVADGHGDEARVGVLPPPRPHRAVEGGLAGGVGTRARGTATGRDRREEDDHALGDQVLERGLRHERRPDGVGRDDVVPRPGGDLVERRQRRHAGGVHERVEPAHRVDRLADQLPATVTVLDVGGDAGAGAGGGDHLRQLVRAATDHGDVRRPRSRPPSAVPRPMPAEPPTTRMRFPVRSMSMLMARRLETSAEPIPPPAHIDSDPSALPWRRSSWAMVTTMRAPVAAIG